MHAELKIMRFQTRFGARLKGGKKMLHSFTVQGRKAMEKHLSVLLVGSAFLLNCSGSGTTGLPAGSEGGPCYGNGTCDAGLVCNAENFCEQSNNPCDGVTCSGHGTCAVMSGNTPTCVCDTGYHDEGLECVEDDPIAPCDGVTCSGHGSCVDNNGVPECYCDPGYRAVGLTCIARDDSALLFLSDFETGNIQSPASNPDGWSEQSCYDYSFEMETNIVRAGNHAIKIHLSQNDEYECFGYHGDETYHRARAQIYQNITCLQNREGQWTGWSRFIPDDFPATGEVNISSYWGCISNIIDSNGNERWHSRWGTGPGNDPDETEDVYNEPYTKGEWVDWVMYYYPSWEGDGVLKIWKNGVQVVNKSGANCIEGRIEWIPLIFKLYKWNWLWTPTEYDELTIYFDEIRVARGPATQEYYDLVAP